MGQILLHVVCGSVDERKCVLPIAIEVPDPDAFSQSDLLEHLLSFIKSQLRQMVTEFTSSKPKWRQLSDERIVLSYTFEATEPEYSVLKLGKPIFAENDDENSDYKGGSLTSFTVSKHSLLVRAVAR